MSDEMRAQREQMEEEARAMRVAMEAEQQRMVLEFAEKKQTMAAELERQQKRAATLNKVHSRVNMVQKSQLKDRKELEERQQAELERQALEREGGARREEFAALNVTKGEKLRVVNDQIKMLALSERENAGQKKVG